MRLADKIIFHRIKDNLFLMNLSKTNVHIKIDGLLADVIEDLALRPKRVDDLLLHFAGLHDLNKGETKFILKQLRSLEAEGFLEETTKKLSSKKSKSPKTRRASASPR